MRNWIIVHLILPTVPFIFAGFIRLIMDSWHFHWSTFSASELAICFVLLFLLLNQNLLKSERVLDDDDKREEARHQAIYVLVGASFYLAFFVVIVVLGAAITYLDFSLQKQLHTFEIIIYSSIPLALAYSILLQRSFRLRTRIW